MTVSAAKFEVGQVVHHLKFGYRGVVFDVDPCFQGTEGWYEQVARSRPPKDKPWYHVLVHDAAHTTYVAERHLEPDRRADLSSTGCWTGCSAALRTAVTAPCDPSIETHTRSCCAAAIGSYKH